MKLHSIHYNDQPDEPIIATTFPASPAAVRMVLDAPITPPDGNDGRSEYVWLRLANGDLILGVWPQGDLYFAVELLVEADYVTAAAQ